MRLAKHGALECAPKDGRYERFTVEELREIAVFWSVAAVPYWLFPDLTDDAVIARMGGLTPFLENIRGKQQEAAVPLAKPVRAPKRT